MPSLIALLNRALPFATPGTPLFQDLLHLTALCVLLYFAPQIQEAYQKRHATSQSEAILPESDHIQENAATVIEPDPEPNHTVPNDLPIPAAEPEAQNQHHQLPAHLPQAPDNAQNNPHLEPGNQPHQPQQAQIGAAAADRTIGAKKAKSLARKDQKRAYNEFMRSQGEAQRAREAEGAAERETLLAAERERRRAAEIALEAQKVRDRDARREREERERRELARRTEVVLSTVRAALEDKEGGGGMCDLFSLARGLGDDVDEEWVERIIRAGGMLGKSKDGSAVTMITGMGWCVRISREDMGRVYEVALERGVGDEDGRIGNEALGGLLEEVLRGK